MRTGKCIHDIDEKHTLVDLNRAGTGLLEIVFQPDLQSPAEIGYLVQHLQRILRCIDVSDGNMEDGSLRCDLNVSVRPVGVEESIDCNTHTNPELLGQRVESKNMNSIRNMIRAAEFEAKRQIAWIEETSSPVAAETRSFDSISGITVSDFTFTFAHLIRCNLSCRKNPGLKRRKRTIASCQNLTCCH